MPRHAVSTLLAVLLDLITLVALCLLLRFDLVQREVGTGLIGALIGARARWLSEGPSHPQGPTTPPGPPTMVGRADKGHHEAVNTLREGFEQSVFGAVFWPVFRFGGAS